MKVIMTVKYINVGLCMKLAVEIQL